MSNIEALFGYGIIVEVDEFANYVYTKYNIHDQGVGEILEKVSEIISKKIGYRIEFEFEVDKSSLFIYMKPYSIHSVKTTKRTQDDDFPESHLSETYSLSKSQAEAVKEFGNNLGTFKWIPFGYLSC